MALDLNNIDKCGSFNINEKKALTKTFRSLSGTAGVTPQANPTELTDSTGGSATNTLAAITAGAAYAQADATAMKNAIASLAAKLTAVQEALKSAGVLT